MAPDVAEALARLGRRIGWVGDDDLVFPGEAGDYLFPLRPNRDLRRLSLLRIS